MVARAQAAEHTRRAILDATLAVFGDADVDQLTLQAVAERAQVTLQTVLRRFGSKAGLLEACVVDATATIKASREPARPGDHRAAIRVLVDSYEEMGELNWRLLLHEAEQPALRDALVGARALHRDWIAAHLGHLVPAGRGRALALALLFTATDFYVWKLHRRDLRRTRAHTEAIMVQMVEAIASHLEHRP